MLNDLLIQSTDSSNNSLKECPDREDFQNAVDGANLGDTDKLLELQQLLDKHPEIWNQLGDLSKHAVMSLVRMIAGGNRCLHESIIRSVQQLTLDLSESQQPTTVERLLISGVVCAWLEVQLAIEKSTSLGEESLRRSRFHLKLRESANRRFESSVRVLQQYRIREVKLVRLKGKIAAEVQARQADYTQVLASEYPWLEQRTALGE
ncbi:MAG TPA: hypothetical protein EYQ00_07750 [Dehalococcoidia bacterium]|nr:hypothetical protein [Dehalococcoidia bacterium]